MLDKSRSEPNCGTIGISTREKFWWSFCQPSGKCFFYRRQGSARCRRGVPGIRTKSLSIGRWLVSEVLIGLPEFNALNLGHFVIWYSGSCWHGRDCPGLVRCFLGYGVCFGFLQNDTFCMLPFPFEFCSTTCWDKRNIRPSGIGPGNILHGKG